MGIRHEALSRRLQIDPELTLTRLVRQEEAVKEQQVALKMDKDGEESVQVEIERMKIHKPKEPTSKQPCWRCENLHDYENALPTEQHVTVVTVKGKFSQYFVTNINSTE